MVFTHSGNSGDIVFCIPTIQALCKRHSSDAILYIKASKYVYGNQYDFVKYLLLQQDSIKEVHPFVPINADDWNYEKWPGLKFDYDLDQARRQQGKGRIHIIKRYFDEFGIKEDHTKPFLKVDNDYKRDEKFALIHLTDRWNSLRYDWKKIYTEALKRHEKVYFIGFVGEHFEFTIRYGDIEHIITETLLDLARLIRDSEALYCNQGVALTIAQGLGKEYYLAPSWDGQMPMIAGRNYKTNTLIRTPNEHLFGKDYLIPDHKLVLKGKPDSHINFIMGDKNK